MSRRAIGLVVACVGIGALLVPSFAGAATSEKQDVVVVNGVDRPVPVAGTVLVKGTPDVAVANTPDVNVANVPRVSVANTPGVTVENFPSGPQPYQQTLRASLGCKELPVPEGKTVVVETVNLIVSSEERPGSVLHTSLRRETGSHSMSVQVDWFRGASSGDWHGIYEGVLFAGPAKIQSVEGRAVLSLCASLPGQVGDGVDAAALFTGYLIDHDIVSPDIFG